MFFFLPWGTAGREVVGRKEVLHKKKEKRREKKKKKFEKKAFERMSLKGEIDVHKRPILMTCTKFRTLKNNGDRNT